MSQADVDNLRAFSQTFDIKAWASKDVSLLDPEVVYEDDNLPDHAGEPYRGHEGVARAAERWGEPFEQLTVELEQIVGSGDRLVSIHRIRAKFMHTGIEQEGPVAYLWTFRDGKIIHFRSYVNPDEALEAAGLNE